MLGDLNQKCVSDIELRQELIVIRCDEDRTLSIMQDKGGAALHLIYKVSFFVEVEAMLDITYQDLVVIRHSESAYQIYLHGDSALFGVFTEVFEVFVGPEESQIFQTSYPLLEDKSFAIQPAMKDQYLLVRIKGKRTMSAVRLCNYSEWHNIGYNTCQPCRSSRAGGFAFPLEVNG